MPSYNRYKDGAICKYFINNRCKYGKKCKLYHPTSNQIKTLSVKKEVNRKSGHCYCGSYLRTILNRFSTRNDDNFPVFFRVCARTGSSMKKCKNL